MKKKYLLLSLLMSFFSISFSFAETCPETAFTTGTSIYTVYPIGTSDCINRPIVLTVGSSIFTRVICEDGYSLYDLTSGLEITPTDPFTIDTGFDTSCTYNGGVFGEKEIGMINKKSFRLFPNPLSLANQKNLNLKLALNTSAKINIYDITGKIVLQDYLDNTTFKSLNVGALRQGIYMLKISTNTFSLSRKIVIIK
ncbi:T9SS type A sorting domain-containing protein [Flavobacteriaceae bacterium]|mgnify:CR=1 FL=1|jgi:hypothetical protein|nr:T9SS type A sorting domain-containing protein [Flavobacteriaceae bacterium]